MTSVIVVITVIFSLIVSVVYYRIIELSSNDLCEIEKCPYCYGTDLCDRFLENKFILKRNSFKSLFANYFGVKNVFYASYDKNDVVIKKLAHNNELTKFDELICTLNNLEENCNVGQIKNLRNSFLTKIQDHLMVSDVNKVHNFRLCTNETVQQFLDAVLGNSLREGKLINVWSILQVNVEPLLLQLLKYEDGWSVPQYLGACGRTIVESDCGVSLNDYSQVNWSIRAKLALTLLLAARKFTDGHPHFRFYLTDISPDNIAVNAKHEVSFVDLENVIVVSRNTTGSNIHRSDFNDLDTFSFSEYEICSSDLSDHNYYAVCKLILSKSAPWPMINGGLLHSPPNYIQKFHRLLFEHIELCANPNKKMDRFKATESIINYLQTISN